MEKGARAPKKHAERTKKWTLFFLNIDHKVYVHYLLLHRSSTLWLHYFSHLVLCVTCVYVCNKYWTRQRVVPTLSFGKRKARIVSLSPLSRDWLISTDKGGQTNTLLIRSEPPPPCGFSFKSLPSKLIIG